MADIPQCPNCGSTASVVMQFEKPLVEWNFTEQGAYIGMSQENTQYDPTRFYCDECSRERLDLQVSLNEYGEWELLPADAREDEDA
jgi:hypothetical protein